MASGVMSRVVSGRVMHHRHHPVQNRFVYPVFFLLLKLDELERLDSWLFGVNRWRPLAFLQSDHGDGGDPRLWVGAQLAQAGVEDCNGPIWVQTFPRVFGCLFNPVSFWYCQRDDDSVGAILAEVNNTFGERHCYLLRPDRESGRFEGVYAEKVLYVSPFYPVAGGYDFRINTDFETPRVAIDYFNEGKLQLNTAIWGKSRPLTSRSLLSALLRQPLLTLGVIFRIHWQAFRLWRAGLSLCERRATSAKEISR
ncbi:MAG: DUF1365 domain-containing protein [Pseudomonadota bacterium]